MGTTYWIRVTLMVCALIGIIYIMRKLNQSPGSMAIAAHSRSAKWVEGVNLCPTRITRLEHGNFTIFEEGMNWFRARSRGGEREKLDSVAVEKWFSQNCTFAGRPTAPGGAPGRAALKVYFVNGEPQTLVQSAGGGFGWMGHWFTSSQLESAIQQLPALPAAATQ